MNATVRIIGIAGGIGSGKSVLSRILRLKGYDVYDCDSRAKVLMSASEEIMHQLRMWCGDCVISDDGALCRAELARQIFSDQELRGKVNKLVHRCVLDDFKSWCSQRVYRLVFVESAVMVTSGLDRLCDRIFLVTAPEHVRVVRAMQRDGCSRQQALSRVEAQKNEEQLLLQDPKTIALANDGSALLPQLEGVFKEFIS